nr:MAG TPA: hypothetical protein [Caudoviricetes sp.]
MNWQRVSGRTSYANGLPALLLMYHLSFLFAKSPLT